MLYPFIGEFKDRSVKEIFSILLKREGKKRENTKKGGKKLRSAFIQLLMHSGKQCLEGVIQKFIKMLVLNPNN